MIKKLKRHFVAVSGIGKSLSKTGEVNEDEDQILKHIGVAGKRDLSSLETQITRAINCAKNRNKSREDLIEILENILK